MPEPLVLTGVSKSYGERSVLEGIDLNVEPGATLAVMGPSGSGKSTLLNLLGSLDRPTAGAIRLGSIEVESLSGSVLSEYRARRVGFVFQDHHLLPQLTALENVLLPTLACPTQGSSGRAEALLSRVGLGDRHGAFPHELSGGERQRVAVARALINGPSLLLCDEPTGNLDAETGAEVLALLLSAAAESQRTVVLVTHNPDHAARTGTVYRLVGGRLEAAP